MTSEHDHVYDGRVVRLHPATAAEREDLLLRDWDLFTDATFIGEGGMGRVYRAFDTTLRRDVALKFIRSDESEHTDRFLREARLQARIDHPHVCRIYQIGTRADRLYIAMQYVTGPPLLEAAKQMSLGEKLRVTRSVAGAVHAAHQRGLIHRDIKPSNICLERSALGQWWPYVLDFGLAREIGGSTVTSTDMIVGTPQYVAPEQLHSGKPVDCRTDVYGIGAMLYEILTGTPPFAGFGPVDVLVKVLTEEPKRPRSIDPSIPLDVERVVLTCLEKDPERRYITAADVAADLDRALRGEPIAARPTPPVRRAWKALTRHKAITAVAVTILVAASAFIAETLVSRHRARLTELAAAHYGQELVYLERGLEHAYRTPLHDVRNERDRIARQVATLERAIEASGRPVSGPGNYVVGRVLLQLGRPLEGATRLQRAWDHGYQLPEVAYALGKAYGRIYEAEVERIDRIPSSTVRRLRKEEADRTLRRRAIESLRRSTGVRFESPQYLEALIAYYDGRTPAALASLKKALIDSPWLYDAIVLEGQIRMEQGNRERDSGDIESATGEYRRAAEHFETALEAAPSDPAVRTARCELASAMVGVGPRTELEVMSQLSSAIAACDQALIADPGLVSPRLQKSAAYLNAAIFTRSHGGDPSQAVEAASRLADEAYRVAPRDESASLAVGLAYWWSAVDLFRRGADPRPALQRVVAGFHRTIALNPRFAPAHLNLGNAHLLAADYERRRGGDPRRSVAAAIHSFERALMVEETYVAFNNIAFAHLQEALWTARAGENPEPAFNRAIAASRHAVELNSKVPHSWNTLATVCARLAAWRLDRHTAATADIDEARAAIAKAAALPSSDWETQALQGVVAIAEGRDLTVRGLDPTDAFERARIALDSALVLNPGDAWLRQQLAEHWRRRGEWLLAHGDDANAALAAASTQIDEAIRLNANEAESVTMRNEIRALRHQANERRAFRVAGVRR